MASPVVMSHPWSLTLGLYLMGAGVGSRRERYIGTGAGTSSRFTFLSGLTGGGRGAIDGRAGSLKG